MELVSDKTQDEEPTYFKNIRPVTDRKLVEAAIERAFPTEDSELSAAEQLGYRLGCLDFEGNVNLGLLNAMLQFGLLEDGAQAADASYYLRCALSLE